jgi:hypothetical protein
MYDCPKLNHRYVHAPDPSRPYVIAALRLRSASVRVRGEKRISFVTTQPEALTSATGTLQGIGSSMSAQEAAAAAIHEMFVNTLGIRAGSHAAAKAANAIATS